LERNEEDNFLLIALEPPHTQRQNKGAHCRMLPFSEKPNMVGKRGKGNSWGYQPKEMGY
jgi:hypothetical protein